MSSVILKPYQVEHFNKIIEILQRSYFYIDASEPGTGKTHVTCAVAAYYNIPVVVVCPASAQGTWLSAINTYKTPARDIPGRGYTISYESLAGTISNPPSHGLLMREDREKTITFYPTRLLQQYVNGPTLFIFDEFQKIKNITAAYKAVKAIAHYINSSPTSSRIAFLSGTPIDKKEQVINFLRLVGYINAYNLYTKSGTVITYTGLAELHVNAAKLDSEATRNFVENVTPPKTSKEAVDHAYEVFMSIIKPKVLSTMIRIISVNEQGNPMYSLNIMNGYYIMHPDDEVKYQKAVQNMAVSARYNPETQNIEEGGANLGGLVKALIDAQVSKIQIVIRLIMTDLTTPYMFNGQQCWNKVIFFSEFNEEVLKVIAEALKHYGVSSVLLVTGEIRPAKRNEMFAKFNQDDDTHRVLLANLLVGGMSVNLQDKTGKRRRRMYLMPGYRANDLHQASRRTFREGSIGESYVRFVYGLTKTSGVIETGLLSAMARKGKVMSDVVSGEEGSKIIFSDQYKAEYEVDPNQLLGMDITPSLASSSQPLPERVIEELPEDLEFDKLVIED